MKLKTRIFFLLAALLCSKVVSAQHFLDNYAIGKVKDTEVLIRWEPKSLEQWEAGRTKGYYVETYKVEEKSEVFVEKKLIQPMALADWELAKKGVTDTLLIQFYEGAQNFAFVDESYYSSVTEMFAGSKTRAAADSFRLGMLIYTSTFDFQITKLLGLGHSIKSSPGSKYKVKIYTEGAAKSDTIHLNTFFGKDDLLPFPALEGEFGNKKVKVMWDTKPFKKRYFGYYLEKGTTEQNTQLNDRMPFVNVFDMQGDTTVREMKSELELEANYRNYVFKLVGMDYFGERSTKTSMLRGYGFEELEFSPNIIKATQTDDNKAYLEWYMDPKANRLLKGFQVLRADTLKGEYKIVQQKIPPDLREISIQIDSMLNYYRVEAVPIDGSPLSSFPVFVLGQDTVPPLTPISFEGKCDSSGVVTLKWSKNSELDLWGYRVFTANFMEDEFGPIKPIINDTMALDTIDLKNNLEEIYYYIVAIDMRNNRSIPSSILIVPKPDLTPPLPGGITDCKFNEDRVEIKWYKSTSKDAVLHRLFRKVLKQEDTWTLIAEFDTLNVERTYLDKKITPDSKYAYILTAVDDAKLESLPSKPVTVETKKIGYRKAFDKITTNIDKKGKKGIIKWSFIDPLSIKEVLLYRGKEKDKISMYKIIESDKNMIEEKIEAGQENFYYLCPVFKDDTYGKFSEIVILSNKE